jgi:hypothetical protein
MNKVLLQFWEESERGWGIRSCGCSIHLTPFDRNQYINSIYEGRSNNFIPSEYDRIMGNSMDAFISDVMFSRVKLKGSIRIYEHELNNLMSMAEIIIKDDI